MNSNNRSSMFPFRRSGGKKRGKSQGGQGANGRRQGQGSGGGRRIPNSAAELLGALQPTTKNLAQVLAGNSKASGQVVHARNILQQAERLVDERAVDRLPPKQREDFLEQLARLKLTLADADIEAEMDDEAEPATAASPGMSMDRLRELALSIATVGSTPADQSADRQASPAEPATSEIPDAALAENDAAAEKEAESSAEAKAKPARAKRAGTLRLKTVRHDDADDAADRRPETVR